MTDLPELAGLPALAAVPALGRRLTDAEALMWRLEQDPYLSSTFANVTLLDRAPDFDRLVARLDRASYVFERLRQRVQPMPFGLGAPGWADDPDFDIHLHVRRVALPKPGSLRQLLDLASLIACDPFDRTRPLWQFTVVEGLRGGQAALVQKLHHTIADGASGVMLAMQYLDTERDAPAPPPLDPELVLRVTEATAAGHRSVDAWREALQGSFRLPVALVRQVRDLIADPTSAPDATGGAAETIRAVVAQLGDVQPACSPLWTARSMHRRIEVLRVPFQATRDAARRLGGTLNEAFLTAATEAAGRYHAALGQPVEELRATMTVSTRTADSGANAFSLARLVVPAGDMPLPDRFRAVQQASAAARGSATAAALDTLAGLAAAVPTALVTRLARMQAQTVDFATSNVRGAPIPFYAAGARLLANHPVGPIVGVAFNLTMLSYEDSLDMGVNIDRAAVEDTDLLRSCLEAAFADLAGLSPRRGSSRGSSRGSARRSSPASSTANGRPAARR